MDVFEHGSFNKPAGRNQARQVPSLVLAYTTHGGEP